MYEATISEHPYVKYAKQIREICEPLFRNTPINYFSPHRYYSNNEYSGFMADGEWAEYFIKKNYQNCGIANYQRDVIKSDYTVWSLSSMFSINEKSQELYKSYFENNYRNGITLIERHKEYIQLYSFTSGICDNFINEFLIENLELLHKFVLYFNEKCNSDKELKNAYKKRILCVMF